MFPWRNRFLGTILALVPLQASAQIDVAALDATIEAAVRDWEAPGLAVAVIKDGELVLAKGYGVRRKGRPEPVDEHTLFAIGSTTKAMTAAAIGMLVDEGKLGWDDPVTRYLPEFRVADPFVTRAITLRDLLTHRAGLGNADFLWYGQEVELDEILFRMRYAPQETSLRSAFTYQNIMYAAAGAVVTSVSGTPWDEFVRRRIFVPLGMSRTIATMATLGEQENVASPHYRVDGEVRVIENASVDPVAAAGSVWSSVSDMSRWMRYLLTGRTADGRKLLSDETHRELFRPQTLVDADEFYPTQRLTKPHWMTYGLGWFQHDYDGRAVDFHTGSIDGMVAIHGLIRDEGIGVYVLGNLDHAEVRHAIMYHVFDEFGGERGQPGGPVVRRDWNAELLGLYGALAEEARARRLERDAERRADTSPSVPLGRYAGTYSDPFYGRVTVTLSDTSSLVLHRGPGLTGALSHWHYDTFQVRWDAAWRGSALVTFRLGGAGDVSAIELGGASFARQPE